MLHDIYPHKLNIAWNAGRDRTDGIAVCLRGDKVLARYEDGMTYLPRLSETGAEERIYLFMIDDDAYFLVAEEVSLAGYEYRENVIFRTARPLYTAFAISLASRLDTWYRASRFCGCCAGPTVHSETERAMVCPACGNVIYPRIDPCVITAVTDGDRICLIHYGHQRSRTGSYALVAGYIESGETPEDAVHREVMEEVGLRVKNIRYYKSQPWPVSGSLLLGFFCELDGDDTITADPGELSDALWVSRENMPERSGEISLTAEMMEVFRTGKEKDL